jgi:hypothetical protein
MKGRGGGQASEECVYSGADVCVHPKTAQIGIDRPAERSDQDRDSNQPFATNAYKTSKNNKQTNKRVVLC